MADKLAADFGPGVDRAQVRRMLTELVRQGFLITSLRAPFTVTDPLAHCLDRLRAAGAEDTDAAELLHALQQVAADLARPDQTTRTARRMRRLSPAGRTPLAVDLALDCDVSVPHQVADEMCRAATALMRLTRFPTGQAVWRSYHAAFCDRYGTGALVPVLEVVNPDTGLGFPTAYPGSVLPEPADIPTARDERLLSLAWQAKTCGGEITLTDDLIRDLTAGDRFTTWNIPPHVELAARIHAPTLDALDRGDYTLTVAPARSAGTLISRFTPLATGTGLEDLYRTVPTTVQGALPVQMSFPPVYSHAENVCRIPAYLDDLLPLGEHRAPAEDLVGIEDLAVTATHDRLHLVSISRRQVVDTQVFHALALEKQPPPLARFLAHLPRAFTARWHEFDWGPLAGRLPSLPRIRYGRTVLHPARWRPDTTQLPLARDLDAWQQSLEDWRRRWNCPETVELRDADRTLRLALAEPSYAATLYDHLKRHGHALLYEAPTPDAFGWIGGHAHEIAVPLARTAPAAPSPLRGALPVVTNRSPGHLPGAAGTRWLYAQVFTHPEQHDDILTTHLPGLLDALEPHVGEPVWWFVRYRSPQETDHLRLRFRVPTQEVYGACATTVGTWAARLLDAGMAGDLRLGTYRPEVGRYGTGKAMEAAETVFAADSRLVRAELQAPPAGWHPTARVALSMVDIAAAFLGDLETAVPWLIDRPAGTGEGADREMADQVVRAARDGHLRKLPDAPDARQARAEALAAYRRALPETTDLDGVLGSLLHMHHNRALGIDPDGESVCRRLARQAALAHRAAMEGDR
ncbi:lantibiotic dehydratase [Streptomyces macrosporus]|uniref:Lantibiotic dehydratase n=1 Tax=Streptomyces macrosporus TaxID=44032 RepID=A0ABN3KJF0_9ACTN